MNNLENRSHVLVLRQDRGTAPNSAVRVWRKGIGSRRFNSCRKCSEIALDAVAACTWQVWSRWSRVGDGQTVGRGRRGRDRSKDCDEKSLPCESHGASPPIPESQSQFWHNASSAHHQHRVQRSRCSHRHRPDSAACCVLLLRHWMDSQLHRPSVYLLCRSIIAVRAPWRCDISK